MSIRVAINGFGRIGRLVFRAMRMRPDWEEFDIVAINDLADTETNAHLLKYDSVFGRYPGTITAKDNKLFVDGEDREPVQVFNERNPASLPWKELEIDWVVESTGIFAKREQCAMHLEAGAKKVLLTAPAKDKVDATIVLGVNEDTVGPEDVVISNASCTTNCLAPVAKVLHDNFEIKRGLMTTIHAYTNDQQTADQMHKDLRRARAAAQNIIPTSTGAAKAIGLVIPELAGKLDGMAMRVPVIDGSVVDLTAELGKDVTRDEVNTVMKSAAGGKLKGILEYTEDPIVSGDVIGTDCSSLFDGKSTMVLAGNMVKVVSWYDNEGAYAKRCADAVLKLNQA